MKISKDLERRVLEMADPCHKPARHALDSPARKGMGTRKGRKVKAPRDRGKEKVFDALCLQYGLPIPDHEYYFAKEIDRNWHFDYLFAGWLAVERECSPFAGGKCDACGLWRGGRHNIGKGFMDDIEKYNTAVLMGYSLIRFTGDQFDKGDAFVFIKRVLTEAE